MQINSQNMIYAYIVYCDLHKQYLKSNIVPNAVVMKN